MPREIVPLQSPDTVILPPSALQLEALAMLPLQPPARVKAHSVGDTGAPQHETADAAARSKAC